MQKYYKGTIPALAELNVLEFQLLKGGPFFLFYKEMIFSLVFLSRKKVLKLYLKVMKG